MTVRQPRYSKEEFAQRGDKIYESHVRQQVEEGNQGKIVAIDLDTGDFEIDASEIAACDRLEARHPDAQIWIVRIGSRYVRRFGGQTERTEKCDRLRIYSAIADPVLLETKHNCYQTRHYASC